MTYVLYSIWVVAFLAVGLCLAFFPGKFSQFWRWYVKLGKSSMPDSPSWKPGLGLRFAGLAMILFAIFMLRPITSMIVKDGRQRIVHVAGLSIHRYALGWPNFAFGILLVTGGLFSIIKPLRVGVWFASQFSHQSPPMDAARRAKEGMRLMGCLFVAAGIYLIYIVLKVRG